MNGTQLKEILQQYGYSGITLAKKLKVNQRTVYGWYGNKIIKQSIIDKIVRSTNIPADAFKAPAITNTPQDFENNYGVIHHGKLVQAAMEHKGFAITNLAKLMQVSRPTLYKYFEEKIWPDSRLFQAAEILKVPFAQLKGKGQIQSFEKDIYNLLSNINTQLQENNDLLQKIITKHI